MPDNIASTDQIEWNRLFQALNDHRFGVGIEAFLRVEYLWRQMAPQLPQEGKAALNEFLPYARPLLTINEVQQSNFDKIYRDVFGLTASHEEENNGAGGSTHTSKNPSPAPPETEDRPSNFRKLLQLWRNLQLKHRIAGLGFIAVFCAIVFLCLPAQNKSTQNASNDQTHQNTTPKDPTPKDPTPEGSVLGGQPTPTFTPIPTPTAVPGRLLLVRAVDLATPQNSGALKNQKVSPLAAYGNGVLWAWFNFALVPFLLLLFWKEAQRWKVERSEGQRKPPYAWPIQFPVPFHGPYRSPEFFRLARDMRRRQRDGAQRLDVPSTIKATIAAQGFLRFKYAAARTAPENLWLIEMSDPRDHRAALTADLAQSLKNQGVQLDYWFYGQDLRICRAAKSGLISNLQQLSVHTQDHFLTCFGTGQEFVKVDQDGIDLYSWVHFCERWPNRSLLATEPATLLGVRGALLEQVFPLGIATLSGLRKRIEGVRVDRSRLGDESRLGNHQESISGRTAEQRLSPLPEPPEWDNSDIGASLWGLKLYLNQGGRKNFEWLCACSLYPMLLWDLTLALGHLRSWEENPVTEENLLLLSSLPWFRSGQIPEALRARLMVQLDAAVKLEARELIVQLMESTPAPAESLAHHPFQLELALQKYEIALLRRQQQEDQKPHSSPSNTFESRKAHQQLVKNERVARSALLQQIRQSPVSDVLDNRQLTRRLREGAVSPGVKRVAPWARRYVFHFGLAELGSRSFNWVVVLLLVLAAGMGASSLVASESPTPLSAGAFLKLQMEPSNILFSDVRVGDSFSGSVHFQNESHVPLHVMDLRVAGADAAAFNVRPDMAAELVTKPQRGNIPDGFDVPLSFKPTEERLYKANLIVTVADKQREYIVPLEGSGVKIAVVESDRDSLDFGTVRLGTTSRFDRFKLTYTGKQSRMRLRLKHPNAKEFEVRVLPSLSLNVPFNRYGTESSGTLLKNGSMIEFPSELEVLMASKNRITITRSTTLQIGFKPEQKGPRQSRLTFEGVDQKSTTLVMLSGTGRDRGLAEMRKIELLTLPDSRSSAFETAKSAVIATSIRRELVGQRVLASRIDSSRSWPANDPVNTSLTNADFHIRYANPSASVVSELKNLVLKVFPKAIVGVSKTSGTGDDIQLQILKTRFYLNKKPQFRSPISNLATRRINPDLHGLSVNHPKPVKTYNVFMGYDQPGTGDAVDFIAKPGEPIYAIEDGIQTEQNGTGRVNESITIRGNGWVALYANIVPSSRAVNVLVTKGSVIGRVAGGVTDTSLHFELWINGKALSGKTSEELRRLMAKVLNVPTSSPRPTPTWTPPPTPPPLSSQEQDALSTVLRVLSQISPNTSEAYGLRDYLNALERDTSTTNRLANRNVIWFFGNNLQAMQAQENQFWQLLTRDSGPGLKKVKLNPDTTFREVMALVIKAKTEPLPVSIISFERQIDLRALTPGEKLNQDFSLHYGIMNAKRAILTPGTKKIQVKPLPTYRQDINGTLTEDNVIVSPQVTTTYTLTVTGAKGDVKRRQITVEVEPLKQIVEEAILYVAPTWDKVEEKFRNLDKEVTNNRDTSADQRLFIEMVRQLTNFQNVKILTSKSVEPQFPPFEGTKLSEEQQSVNNRWWRAKVTEYAADYKRSSTPNMDTN